MYKAKCILAITLVLVNVANPAFSIDPSPPVAMECYSAPVMQVTNEAEFMNMQRTIFGGLFGLPASFFNAQYPNNNYSPRDIYYPLQTGVTGLGTYTGVNERGWSYDLDVLYIHQTSVVQAGGTFEITTFAGTVRTAVSQYNIEGIAVRGLGEIQDKYFLIVGTANLCLYQTLVTSLDPAGIQEQLLEYELFIPSQPEPIQSGNQPNPDACDQCDSDYASKVDQINSEFDNQRQAEDNNYNQTLANIEATKNIAIQTAAANWQAVNGQAAAAWAAAMVICTGTFFLPIPGSSGAAVFCALGAAAVFAGAIYSAATVFQGAVNAAKATAAVARQNAKNQHDQAIQRIEANRSWARQRAYDDYLSCLAEHGCVVDGTL